MLAELSHKIISVDPEEVMEKAREYKLNIESVEDFRKAYSKYEYIDEVMEDYRSSFAQSSAIGGLTAGIGGFATSVAFAGFDTISLSIQLYRLSQRFAILNGFDDKDPLQRDRVLNIYFESLGLSAAAQSALKHQLLKAGALAGSKEASENLFLSLIIRSARIFGQQISTQKAGRLIPVFGGIIGAGLNYSFANKISARMKSAYKDAYFDTWPES